MRSSGDYQVALRWSRRACSPPLAPPRSRASRSVDGTRPEEGGKVRIKCHQIAIRGHQGRHQRSSVAITRLDLGEPPGTKLVLARQVREHTRPVRAELLT